MHVKILAKAIEMFNDKGPGFTLAELAAALSISKKTLYKYYDSKEDIIIAVVAKGIEQIRHNERTVYDSNLPTTEKLKKIMCFYPDLGVNYGKLRELKSAYPAIYYRLEQFIEDNWDITSDLIERCIAEGSIKSINGAVFRELATNIFEWIMLSPGNQSEMIVRVVDIVFNGLAIK